MSTAADEAHLARSRRVWDRWSNHYTLSERDFAPMRRAAIDRLDLDAGDRVLDVGCGPGVNFRYLRSYVGNAGEIVAVDYSPSMVARARARARDHGWTNVTVIEADVSSIDLPGPFDAAVATLSMSVLPDVDRGARAVYEVLRPGGRFVVFDVRPVPTGPARILNPAIRRALRWYANWNSDDVSAALERTFETTEHLETYGLGTAVTVLATRTSTT